MRAAPADVRDARRIPAAIPLPQKPSPEESPLGRRQEDGIDRVPSAILCSRQANASNRRVGDMGWPSKVWIQLNLFETLSAYRQLAIGPSVSLYSTRTVAS